jgi:hypothetical protein
MLKKLTTATTGFMYVQGLYEGFFLLDFFEVISSMSESLGKKFRVFSWRKIVMRGSKELLHNYCA